MKITFKELSDLTGIPEKSLHAYASPSKKHRIIKDSDKMFDTDIIKNEEFLKQSLIKKEQKIRDELTVKEEEVDVLTLRRSSLGKDADKIIKGAKEKKIVVKVDTKPNAKANKEKPKQRKPHEDKEKQKEVLYLNEIEKKKSQLMIDKLEKENKLRDLEIERKAGDYIKTEEAISIVRDWSIAKDRRLLELMEKEITYICSRESIPSKRAGKYRMRVTTLINQASKEATKEMSKHEKTR